MESPQADVRWHGGLIVVAGFVMVAQTIFAGSGYDGCDRQRNMSLPAQKVSGILAIVAKNCVGACAAICRVMW